VVGAQALHPDCPAAKGLSERTSAAPGVIRPVADRFRWHFARQKTGQGAELSPLALRSIGVRGLSVASEELLRQLHAEYSGPLIGYTTRLLDGDRARAEDVVQETLLRAWRHPEVFDGSSSAGEARSWLFTVARNLVIDLHRATRVRPLETAEAWDLVPGSDDATLDQVLVAMEVSDALDALSSDHRAVIEELYFRDLSVGQAAESLGVPVGTVKSRAYYALRAMRIACEERGVLR
jgi:RNA polymerase sigma-70 factor (ECF subfamily)